MSGRQIEQIERGIRRTRRSTLERIAFALVEGQPALGIEGHPELGDADVLVAHLVGLAGNGLAPESEYRKRVEKRRKARWARAHRHVLYRQILPMLHAQLDAELREERRAEQAQRRQRARARWR